MLARIVTEPDQLAMWQTYKGWFFISMSALLLWSERAWSDQRVRAAEMRLHERVQERTSELERVRTQLQIILDNAPVAFSMRGVDNRYILTNRRWEEYMGVSSADALGKKPQELFAPDVANALTEALARIWNNKEGILEEVAMNLRGRDYVFMRASFPLFDEGKPYAGIGLITDISESKAVEEQLRQAEERFRAVFQTVGVGINLVAPDGRYVATNPAFQKMLGYSEQELLGKHFKEISYSPDLLEDGILEGQIEQQPGAMAELEKRYVRADGSLVWARVLVSTIRNSDGTPALRVTVVEEITARKEVEAQRRRVQAELERLVAERTVELRAINARLSAILQASPLGIVVLDGQGVVQLWNPAAERIYGYSAAELLGQPMPHLQAANDDAEYLEIRQRTWAGEGFSGLEAKRHRRDGALIDVSISTAPLLDADGALTGLVALVSDITERKRINEALRASEERFARIFYSSPYPTAYGGIMDGVLQDVNDRFAEFFGVSREAMIGHSIVEFGEWLKREDRFVVFSALTKHGKLLDYELALRRGDGKMRDVLMSFYRLDFGGQEVTIGMFTDITERKQAEAEVRRLNHELEARVVERTVHLEQEIAERVRAEAAVHALNATLAEQAQHLVKVNKELETFTYSVSHDLKAPLRGIDGYSRLLLEDYADRLDGEGQYFLNTIRGATAQMAQLIDDLLSYSRLERRSLASSQIDISKLVEDVLSQMQPNHVYPDTLIEVKVEPTLLNADADALSLVLRNLIDNALKFSAKSSPPKVEIGGESSAQSYQLFVRDNGVGFDMQYEERIFDIFQRLHRPEDYPGTGIGLAMVRKALQRMQGRVWAESQPGQGATFTMEIPTS
jgi:PAS domain S-box-containing protein